MADVSRGTIGRRSVASRERVAPSSSSLVAPTGKPETQMQMSYAAMNAVVMPSIPGAIGSLEERLYAIRAQSAAFEKMLVTEAQRRGKHDRDVHERMTHLAMELEERVGRHAQNKLAQLQGSVELLAVKVDGLSRELAQEREKNVRLTEELRYFVEEGLKKSQAALELERKQREEREAMFRGKVIEDANHLLAQIARERDAHKERIEELKAHLAEENEMATRAAREQKESLTHFHRDLVTTKQLLNAEISRRREGENQVATTIDNLVRKITSLK